MGVKRVRRGDVLFKWLALFWAILDLPGGPQEGSRVHGSSIFTFAAGSKKGSKMGAKIESFGLPKPNYTHFGHHLGEIGIQKAASKKRLQNLGGGALQGA